MNENTVIDQESGSMPSETGKTRAIIAHITIIGTIIAWVQNKEEKDDFANFYIRQMIGLFILAIAISVVAAIIITMMPALSILILILRLGILALWILSLIGAVNGKKSLTPGIGQMFQDWFKAI